MSSWPIGEVRECQGSGSKPYKLKNVDDRVFSCTCPAWCNQGGKKPDVRTCKHLKAERGAAVEEARIAANAGGLPPVAAQPVAPVQVPPVPAGPQGDPIALLMAPYKDEPWKTPEGVRAQVVALKEQQLGRKLRQDEKTTLFGPPVLLANDWEDVEDLDPSGWWMSEKLDGVRAYWDGKDFVSRQGNAFNAPAWFKAAMPNHPLDGELWMGRKMFQRTISVVKTTVPDERWKDVKYVVFDAPHLKDPFEARLSRLEEVVFGPRSLAGKNPTPHLVFHEQVRCTSTESMLEELAQLVSLGAEGLMLRKPGSLYVKGRSSTLLKVKPFKDAEAVVIGHEPGKKQHKGKCGGLILRMPNGKVFNVNAGAEAVRLDPPKVGTTVTYRYTELTDGGIPKCASFVRVRPEE